MPGEPGWSAEVQTARRLADEVLFPVALETDRAPAVPRRLLDALAAAGLYGLLGPGATGGLEAEEPTRLAVTEALASGCLTTTFVWAQHHSAVHGVANGPSGLAETWLRPLCRGERRAGVAFAGLRRPGKPVLSARYDGDHWTLEGRAPWVTGWGLVDVIHVAARAKGGEVDGGVAWLLVDAVEGEGLQVTPLALAAASASATVGLRFTGLHVPAERVTRVESFAAWKERDAASLRPNGALALGVTARCCTLLGSTSLDERLAAGREALLRSPPAELARVRADLATLAADASRALVCRAGGRSMLFDHHAQRLAREALFLQVSGQTRAVRDAQLAQIGATSPSS